jgi:hypothetical protein
VTISLDDAGIPAATVGSIEFRENEAPELWAAYPGQRRYFLYTQHNPHSYQIREITLDGVVVRGEFPHQQ